METLTPLVSHFDAPSITFSPFPKCKMGRIEPRNWTELLRMVGLRAGLSRRSLCARPTNLHQPVVLDEGVGYRNSEADFFLPPPRRRHCVLLVVHAPHLLRPVVRRSDPVHGVATAAADVPAAATAAPWRNPLKPSEPTQPSDSLNLL
jgi:hypothetical protein